MHIPYVNYSADKLSDDAIANLDRFGAAIIRNFPDTDDNRVLRSFGESLGQLRRHFSRRTGSLPVSDHDEYVYIVEATSNKLCNAQGQAIISQTHLEFPCHTDEYFLQIPANIIILLCCRSDDRGDGQTVLAHVDEIVAALGQKTRDVLSMPLFPHPDGPVAILSFVCEKWHIRYNREYINGLLAEHFQEITSEAADALAELEGAISTVRSTLLLTCRECIVLHNQRLLHGRTRFEERSLRKMKRVRVHRQEW